MKNIKIIGTSHISSKSLKLIKENVFEFKPNIIAVELDKDRLSALKNPNTKKSSSWSIIKSIGLTGFIFASIGKYVQKKLGSIVNLQPGADMLFATTIAKKNDLKLALIDRHINITLKRFSKQFTFKEKFQIFKDFFMGLISKKHRLKINLKEIPEDELINVLIDKTKDSYPTIYRVLIDERNHYMAKKLIYLHKRFPDDKILAVVGAGHKLEMERLLSIYDKKIEIIY